MDPGDFYWYWINNIDGIGRNTIRGLLDIYKTPERIYEADEEKVFSLLRYQRQKETFRISKDKDMIIQSYQSLMDHEIVFIHPDMKEYPQRLRNIPDFPYGLYLKGRLPDEGHRAVAIIGARNCTQYGREMARFWGRELAKCNVSVISGLARGIDGMAHEGAIEAEGYTLGVLGGGIDRIYPQENYLLFMEMKRSGGILSESNIGIPPAAGLFPQRNRLIAGLCDGILVVEAMEKSGTFITVNQGLEQGKEIFALPGRVTDTASVGCNHLIKLGAHMVTELEDILEILHIEGKTATKLNDKSRQEQITSKMSLAPVEKMVYSCLRVEPKYLDDIIGEVMIAPQEVCMALNHLILCGVVSETTRNYYAVKL